MIVSYFRQLHAAATKAGVDLKICYLDAGFADSTFYRHQQGSHHPDLVTAQNILARIARTFEDRHGVPFDQV